ncbi:MAG: putative 2-aminoethylphosphonate ABC transporter substrate-binding protein [Actinomycetia bacterium]|nr:putative 2-aminoethylphosphonate ABC transporter substrate-binding protein [Actinomycetes bacterium]
MKKVVFFALTILAIALLAGFLAACKNGATATGNKSSGTAGENKNSSTPATGNKGNSTAPTGEGSKGEITVYTALEDEQVEEYLKAFNTRYPDIKVSIVRESTGVITAKLLAEKNNPQADLVWGTAASSLLALDEQGMLEPYAPAGVDGILAKFKSGKAVPTWTGIDVWETAFVINTVEIGKLGLKASDIKSYDDLLRPELKGHVVMPNPASSGTGLLTVTGILQLEGKGTDAGWQYLDKLHQNISQYVHSGSKPAKMAGSGECAVGISFGYAGIQRLRAGEPVAVVFPSNGSGWDLEANALIKKNKISAAAKTFLDWAISEEAMGLYKENYPILANGKGGRYDGFANDPVDQLIDNDLLWVANNRDNILEEWARRFDGKSVPR